MKTTIKTTAMLFALALSLGLASAQDAGGPPPGGGSGGPGMKGHRPPPSPLMEALDANHDGVIDADEIANASVALKTLDKNGDGKLTQDELRPARPPGRGPGGPQGGDNGQPPQNPPANN
ncbi:MAG: hypothetical protein JWR19_2011 [Pedosphaera sp.]|nr:hypothetical protein [Pedosphaera sp.]